MAVPAISRKVNINPSRIKITYNKTVPIVITILKYNKFNH